jgi:methyltransferase-like protein
MHRMIRDMMCYHTAHFPEPQRRIQQARALLNFLAESVPVEDNPYGMLLKREVEFLNRQADSYLFHEFLEEVNDPIYFHQFIEQAAARKLQYLGEADVASLAQPDLPPKIDQVLKQVSANWVHMQQYLDFLRNMQFRMSLLCHDRVKLNRVANVEVMEAYHVASAVRPMSPNPEILSNKEEEFRNPQNESVKPRHPIIKAALQYLGQIWPQAVAFDKLEAAASACVHPGEEVDAAQRAEERHLLASALINCCLKSHLVDLHVHAPTVVATASERPVASLLARYQAVASGQRLPKVTNVYHYNIQLNDVERLVLPRLDGTRDRDTLLDELSGMVQRGVLGMRVDPTVVQDPSKMRAVLARNLDELLRRMAFSALLVA